MIIFLFQIVKHISKVLDVLLGPFPHIITYMYHVYRYVCHLQLACNVNAAAIHAMPEVASYSDSGFVHVDADFSDFDFDFDEHDVE